MPSISTGILVGQHSVNWSPGTVVRKSSWLGGMPMENCNPSRAKSDSVTSMRGIPNSRRAAAICAIWLDPKVEVFGEAGLGVVGHCVPSDDEVADAMSAEQT